MSDVDSMLTYLTSIRDVRRDAIEEAQIEAEEAEQRENQQDETETDTTE